MKKITCIILTFFTVSCLLSSFSFAEDNASYDETQEVLSAFEQTVLKDSFEQTEQLQTEDIAILCSNAIEDDFSDNLIIVYIKREYSAVQQTYTVEDFPYLELSGASA